MTDEQLARTEAEVPTIRAIVDETTTSADALTAEKAVEFAKKEIDGGGLI